MTIIPRITIGVRRDVDVRALGLVWGTESARHEIGVVLWKTFYYIGVE